MKRFTDEGLSHHSYYIADQGEALVCDPRRDVDAYLELARSRGENIRYVLETHRNEDYAIGSTALGELGATICHSAKQDFSYGTAVPEGERLGLGRLEIEVLETPGHTWDSLSYAIADTSTSRDAFAVLTGDALFVGDTGRTDLLGPDQAESLARSLHSSVQRLLELGDGVALLPAHGAGSVCGGGISHRDLSTLGFERATQALLNASTEQFVHAKLDEDHVRPPYFRLMEEWNLRGNAPILHRLPVPRWAGPGDFAALLEAGERVLDLREPQAFAGGHIPGSYNLWLEGVPSYLGWVAPPREPLYVVLPDARDAERVLRMCVRLGYDDVTFLQGGFEAWRNAGRPLGSLGTLDAEEALQRDPLILDVRTPAEWAAGSPEGSLKIYVGHLEDRIDEVPHDREVVTMCGVGSRAGLAASILARHGHGRVANLLGGMKGWTQRQSG